MPKTSAAMLSPPDNDAPSVDPRRGDHPLDLGIYGRDPVGPAFGGLEAGAVVFCVILLAAAAGWVATLWGGPSLTPDWMPAVFTMLGVAIPLGMICVVTLTLRTAARLRAEAASIRAALEATRKAQIAQQQTGALRPAAARAAEKPVPDRRPLSAARPVTPEEQPALELGTPPEESGPSLTAADYIRALNFPDTDQDTEGFRVLRLALADRSLAKLIRAAQDILTLLSQDGIYMDDLIPEPAPAADWRRFAAGERGRVIGAIGGVHDRSALALTGTRMRQDPIFRDAAHHFLRQFDRSVSDFAKTAPDEDIEALAQTRTARAFMLLGRVTGTFD